MADDWAKSVAKQEKPTSVDMELVRREAQRVTEAAMWIGRVTTLANHYPNPAWQAGMSRDQKFLRDSQGCKSSQNRARPNKRKLADSEESPPPLGDLSHCEWWRQMRERIAAKCPRMS